MDDWTPTEEQLAGVYAAFWRFMDMSIHRYGSAPTGHVLVVLTFILLDRVNHLPTISELADITRLSKSAVSRYVAAELKRGFLEEIVDSDDRRRRLLKLTSTAHKELAWHKDTIRDNLAKGSRSFRDDDFSKNAFGDLKKILIDGYK